MPSLLALLLLLGAAGGAASPPRGYQPRGCGFDLDDDGVPGEPSDCRICDARLNEGRISGGTADPDGDGTDEDLIYVDCDRGIDQPGCGSAGQPPCRSIAFAFASRSDGPGDGAEDIVCFRGTCSEPADLTPAVGGVEGHRVQPRSGSEEWDFQFPTDPAMLVGWDADGDGSYPPFDTDDVAVMDGDPDGLLNGNGAERAFRLNHGFGVDNSYFEMAHFVVEDYGVDDVESKGGFLAVNSGLQGGSHLYLHDLSLVRINKDRPGKSGRATFNWFAVRDYSYVAVINVEAIEHGGYFNRGAGPEEGPDAGPVRFQNVSFSAHSCDFTDDDGGICRDRPGLHAFATVAKIWGYASRFEWLDSVWDANVDAWIPRPKGGVAGAQGIGPAQCAQDWVIRNNEFIDFKVAMGIQAWDPKSCRTPGRPVTGIVFDGNTVRNAYEPWEFGDHAVAIGGNGPTELRTTGDIAITNNVISSTTGLQAIIDIRAGNQRAPNPGTIVVAGNTFDAEINRPGFAAILVQDQGASFPHQDIVIRNNIFGEVGPQALTIRTTFEVEKWQADHNIFLPGARFSWNEGTPVWLSQWQAQSGGDGDSKQCEPRFVDPAAGDYRLESDDACARGAGAGSEPTRVGAAPAEGPAATAGASSRERR